jgi:hypothetical protein
MLGACNKWAQHELSLLGLFFSQVFRKARYDQKGSVIFSRRWSESDNNCMFIALILQEILWKGNL